MVNYILIYLLFGLIPAYKNAQKEYDKFEKTYNPSMYEVRFKWLAKSIHSIVFGLSFIISLALWLPLVIENLIKKVIKNK